MANNGKIRRSKGSLTAKGRATRRSILDAAHEVFKTKGFYGSCISEMTRSCGVSTATFYQYFKNKEQAFQEVNDLIISRFMQHTKPISLAGLSFRKGWSDDQRDPPCRIRRYRCQSLFDFISTPSGNNR